MFNPEWALLSNDSHLCRVREVVEDAEARAVPGECVVRAAGGVARQASLQSQLRRKQRAWAESVVLPAFNNHILPIHPPEVFARKRLLIR